ncbi:hypothetical protein PR003_g19793 [Phytophthora rubi]|uniref:Uncharacterized protein n=1 Tax=Phytophthora rubi TaxID=129364 RepID=A0A6A4DUH2_9STRA|nr:hypothetical protein PR003_g19793 [Phytophthora rubi]
MLEAPAFRNNTFVATRLGTSLSASMFEAFALGQGTFLASWVIAVFV